MRQHTHEVLPRLGLRDVELALDVLQRQQAVALACDDILGCRQRQLVLDAVDDEGNQLPLSRGRLCHGVVEAVAELVQVSELRDLRRTEQAPRRVVLQCDRAVAVNRQQRNRDMVDQRAQMAQVHLEVRALLVHPVQDVGKCRREFAETGAEILVAEALRVVGVPRRIEEPCNLTIGSADKPPELSRGSDNDSERDQGRAVQPGLQHKPQRSGNCGAENTETQGEQQREALIDHAFPCAGRATPASGRDPLPRERY